MVHNAFHQEHSHGRVFHGLEARAMLEMEKRDIKKDVLRHVDKPDLKKDVLRHAEKPDLKKDVLRHHDKPDIKKDVLRHHDSKPDASDLSNKDRFIHHLGGLHQKQAEVQTVYDEVHVTVTGPSPTAAASATMNAGQAAYESAKAAANAPQTAGVSSAAPSLVTVPTQRTRTPVTVPTQRTRTSQSTASSAPASSAIPSTQVAAVHAGSPVATSREPSVVGGTPLSATHGSDQLISQHNEGMTSGAKAGLAIGILAALGLCAGLIFFCLRRRKQQKKNEGAERLDEKHASQDSFFGGMAAAAARGPGDRGSIQSEKSARSSRTASTAPRLSLRPVTQFLPNIIENRKSNGNSLNVPNMSEKPRSGWDRRPAGAEQNPFDDAAVVDEKNARSPSPPSNPFDEGDGTAAKDQEPPTPKSAKFGTAAAVPIAAAGAPNGGQMPRGPNNVHRVQLDFKPSMEDELELRSGQLVRMLHEYDDGWALCIRLDRSQQGVCPRTCLSKLPVKPRPQGPPPPNGAQGRPMGPPPPGAARRPASPQMNNAMVPRPLTPTGRERSQTLGRSSPGPAEQTGRPRSQSTGGASMPARKPVPGMAL